MITARQLLDIYRSERTVEQEVALLDFLELSEHERWELLFIGLVKTSHTSEEALKKAKS